MLYYTRDTFTIGVPKEYKEGALEAFNVTSHGFQLKAQTTYELLTMSSMNSYS